MKAKQTSMKARRGLAMCFTSETWGRLCADVRFFDALRRDIEEAAGLADIIQTEWITA